MNGMKKWTKPLTIKTSKSDKQQEKEEKQQERKAEIAFNELVRRARAKEALIELTEHKNTKT